MMMERVKGRVRGVWNTAASRPDTHATAELMAKKLAMISSQT